MFVEEYMTVFTHLSVKVTNGKKAPNKAIMLLSVMDLIRMGYITENRIYLDGAIEDSFRRNWTAYFLEKAPNAWTPFWHLKNEPFWHFKSLVNDAYLQAIVNPGETASIGKMREVILYAYLDDDLYAIMKTKRDRDRLIETLLKTYVYNS